MHLEEHEAFEQTVAPTMSERSEVRSDVRFMVHTLKYNFSGVC